MKAGAPYANGYLSAISIACIAVVVVTMFFGYRNMQQDDSYIFYSYAKNIADGDGYVFNIGERVNATTSPLYTLLLALIYKVFSFLPFMTLPLIGRIIGGVSLFFLCYFLTVCFRERDESFFGYLIPLMLLANPLLTNALGLELSLSMMLGVAAVSHYVKGKYSASALFCSLAVLARPDMVIVAFLVLLHYIVRHRRLPGVVASVLFCLPIGIWLVFSWFYFGSLLPSTLAAKLVQTEAGLWGGQYALLEGLFSASNWYVGIVTRDIVPVLLLLLLLVGAGVAAGLITMGAKLREWTVFKHPGLQILLLWGLLHYAIYGLILKAPAYSWYYTPLAPGIAVLMTLPLVGLYRLIRQTTSMTKEVFPATIILVTCLVGLLLPITSSGRSTSWEYETHKQAALWLNEHADDGASVGTGDIDILRFFYVKGPVIDALGLVTPAVIAHIREHDFSWYIREYKPDFLVFPQASRSEFESVVDEDWFNQQYELQTVIGDPGEAVGIYERTIHPGDSREPAS